MMPALIISDNMINHDASSYTDHNCSGNFASPFAAGVIAGRVIVSGVLLHSVRVRSNVSGRRLLPPLASTC